MIQVARIDSDGLYVEPVLLDDDTELFIQKDDLVGVTIPTGLHWPKWDGSEWIEGKPDELLETKKQNKLDELDAKCNQTILGDFSADVDGVTYSFGHDERAQANFSSAKLGFMDGSIDALFGGLVPWTAYDAKGKVVRLKLNKDQFSKVFIAHLSHTNGNIGKFRDDLEPKVHACSKPEDVDKIVW
jgi:hypothetical protein